MSINTRQVVSGHSMFVAPYIFILAIESQHYCFPFLCCVMNQCLCFRIVFDSYACICNIDPQHILRPACRPIGSNIPGSPNESFNLDLGKEDEFFHLFFLPALLSLIREVEQLDCFSYIVRGKCIQKLIVLLFGQTAIKINSFRFDHNAKISIISQLLVQLSQVLRDMDSVFP